MSKLFAFENDDAAVIDADLDTDLADVAGEMTDELAAVETTTDAVDAGVEATTPLGEVQDLVSDAVESGEGLDSVAAEAVRIALKSVCRTIGADPKVMYPLYATENFDGASSRLGSSKLALEGITEFAKDLYKRIKAALERLWKKIKAFWDKHFSTLGRLKKAAVEMKKRVAKLKELKGAPFIDTMPGAFATAFFPDGELTIKDVAKTESALADLREGYLNGLEKVVALCVSLAVLADKTAPDAVRTEGGKMIGTFAPGGDIFPKVENLVGGYSIHAYVEVDGGDDTTLGDVTFKFDRESSDKDSDVSKGMRVASKQELVDLCVSVEKAIDKMIESKKNIDKANSKVLEMLQKVGEDAEKYVADKEAAKSETIAKKVRMVMSMCYKSSSLVGRGHTTVTAEGVRFCKAALAYISYNAKQYK